MSGVPPEHPEVVEGIRAALKGENEKADKFFAEAMEKNPGSRPGGIDAAMAFMDEKYDFQFYGKMRAWLERTAEDYPDDPEAYFLLADIAQFQNRYFECKLLTDHGLAMVEKLDVNKPRQLSLRIYGENVLAKLAEQQERWAVAEEHYRKLIELEPDNAEHLYKLGIVQFRLGRQEEALKSLAAAEAKNSRLLPPGIVLAQLSDSEGKTDEAVKFLDEVLKTHGKDVRVLCAAADLELKWNHLDKARVLAEKARKIDLSAVDPLLTLGILDLYDGNFTEAESKFMTIIESLPEDSRAMAGLALALAEQNEPRQLRRAFSIAKENVDKNPNSVDAQTTLAWVLIRADSLDEAEKILLRHFDAQELNSPGAYYYAVLMVKQNRKDEAKKFLRAALETQTNFPKRIAAKQLLQALENENH